MSWLIVGLGNPGPKYANNRHNIGFMVVDELARRAGTDTSQKKFHGLYCKARLGREDAILLKPQQYMNRSGTSVGAAGAFYKLDPDKVLVIHDELDIDFHAIQVKVGGGHGGHNGLRSIFQHFGKGFVRLRCGIGRPPYNGDVSGWVLSDFSKEEVAELPDFIYDAANAAEAILAEGPASAMNSYNGKARAPSK